jgi:chromate transporter
VCPDDRAQESAGGAPGRVREVAAVFLKLGVIAFGGPAAHIAIMRDEVVRRRRWVTDEQFLDLLGASNVIPGPTSTELAIYLGYVRAGWRGLLLAGALFIMPATLIVLAFAEAYTRYHATSGAAAALYGIKPVIIGVILVALWGLLKTSVKSVLGAVVGVAALTAFLLGVHPIVVLAAGGIATLAARRPSWWCGAGVLGVGLPAASAPVAGVAPYGLGTLALVFLKIGAVVYGSGYVLLAFLRADFVERLKWLTDRELIDAVAVGQFTPGPVFTTATFIGFLVGGVPGALVASVAIFVPSFVFVAAVSVLLPRVQTSVTVRAALDGVNVAALGLMAGVTWQLGQAAVVDATTAALAVTVTFALMALPLNSAWLIGAGAALGLALRRS